METPQPWLSLCMMVKDEELLLEQAIASVRDIVDEIVVVDTGSTDRTREIAVRCGARLFEHAWDGNFGLGRNAYLDHARGEWVLVLDGDEKVAARDAVRIRALTDNAGAVAYRFLVHNYTRGFDLLCDWHPNDGLYPEEESFSQCPGYSRFRVARLFRRWPAVRYDEGPSAHTNPLRSLRATGGTIGDADIVIHHYQYRKGGEAFVARKQRERLEGERKHLDLHPEDALAYLNAGRTLFSLGDDDLALHHLNRAVELDSEAEQARLSRAIVRYETGDYSGAASDLEAAVAFAPAFADGWTVLGMAYHALERPEAAAAAFAKALALQPSHPMALNSFGVLLMDLGELERAEQKFRQALAILPEHPAARSNLRALLESGNTVDESFVAEVADKADEV